MRKETLITIGKHITETNAKLAELEEKLNRVRQGQGAYMKVLSERLEELWARCDLQFPQFARWHIEDMERLDKLDVMVDDANVSHGHILLRLEKLEAEA